MNEYNLAVFNGKSIQVTLSIGTVMSADSFKCYQNGVLLDEAKEACLVPWNAIAMVQELADEPVFDG